MQFFFRSECVAVSKVKVDPSVAQQGACPKSLLQPVFVRSCIIVRAL